jgi:TM2 domain-containing membrane protein YozV
MAVISMKYCSNCGKPLSNESSNFCDNCGSKIGPSNPTGQIDYPQSTSNIKEEKNPYLALLCSFFIPGLGQVYNGSAAKGIGFFFGTLIGIFLFIIPGVVVWIVGMIDAYSVAEKMKNQEIPLVPTKTAHLILFLMLVGFITALVILLIWIFFLTMILASFASIMQANSPPAHTNFPSTGYQAYSAPVKTPVPTIRTPYPTPIPTIRHAITEGFWCRKTSINIGKALTDVEECYQFFPDGTFKYGYSPGWPMGKSPSCSGEWGAKCTYSINPSGKYEVQGGYIFTLSGDQLIDPHNAPYYRWSPNGIP